MRFKGSQNAKLMVYIGNEATFLYRKLGFVSGPEFVNLVKESCNRADFVRILPVFFEKSRQ